MKDEEALFQMTNTLTHFFDEFIDRVQVLVEEQVIDDFKQDPSGIVLSIMKQAMSELERDLESVTRDMKESKTINISELVNMIEDITNKNGNDDGSEGNGGLH